MADDGAQALSRERVNVFEWGKRLRRDAKASGLRPASIGPLALLATFADPDGGNAWPAASTLAEGVGIRRQTIGTAWADGLACGWLEVTARPVGRSVTYALTAPKLEQGVGLKAHRGGPQSEHPPEAASEPHAAEGWAAGRTGGGPESEQGVGLKAHRGGPDREHDQSLYMPLDLLHTSTEDDGDPDTSPRGAAAWVAFEDPAYAAFCALKLQPLRG